MSYFKQVLCYACREAVSIMNALAVPTDSEATTYNIGSWNSTNFLGTPANFEAWQKYTDYKLFGGNKDAAVAPALANGVLLGQTLTCTDGKDQVFLNYNGTQVQVPAGTTCEGAKSLSAYLWLAAREGLDATSLCDNAFNCSPKSQKSQKGRGKSRVK